MNNTIYRHIVPHTRFYSLSDVNMEDLQPERWDNDIKISWGVTYLIDLYRIYCLLWAETSVNALHLSCTGVLAGSFRLYHCINIYHGHVMTDGRQSMGIYLYVVSAIQCFKSESNIIELDISNTSKPYFSIKWWVVSWLVLFFGQPWIQLKLGYHIKFSNE